MSKSKKDESEPNVLGSKGKERMLGKKKKKKQSGNRRYVRSDYKNA